MWPGRDADPSAPSSAEVKNRVVSIRAFVAYESVKPSYILLAVFIDKNTFPFFTFTNGFKKFLIITCRSDCCHEIYYIYL